MEYSCEFCNSKFKSKYNLNTHIKSAKFCINNRDQNNNINNYPCKYCNKTFTVKNKLNMHYESCIEYQIHKKTEDYDDIILQKDLKIKELETILKEQKQNNIDLQKQINELQDKLIKLCNKAIDKPTTINNKSENNSINTTYNHLQPINLSPEHIYQVFDQNLKLEDIYKGQKGLANVVAKKLLTDENGRPLAFCNDKSRQIIKYKDENNQIIKDAKAFNLVSSIAPVAEKIALKRKKEFEDIHYPKEEVKTKPPTPKKNRKDDEDYVGFEDEDTDLEDFDDSDLEDDEINDELKDIQSEKDKDIQKQKFKEIYNRIENEKNWSQEKKDYYHNKMINGITDLQILTANCNGFTKQLSMVLPAEKKI